MAHETTNCDLILNRIAVHGCKSDQIEELCLDGLDITYFTDQIKKIIETCINAQYLTLNDCGIKSLKNFPSLPTLVALQLSENKIKGSELKNLTHLKQLEQIALDRNQISSCDEIGELQKIPKLEQIQIFGNPICKQVNHRQKIFQKIKQLEILDCKDKQGNWIRNDSNSNSCNISDVYSFEQLEKIQLQILDNQNPNKKVKQ